VSELGAALAAHPFTRGLDDVHRAQLEGLARRQTLAAGALLLREGEAADTLFLVEDGRVSLEQHVPGRGTMRVEDLGPGDVVGLSWVFPGRRWVLDARAVATTRVLGLDAAGLHALMMADAALARTLLQGLVGQLYTRLERARLQRLDVYRSSP
jgi:CRP-like cAMP-binding protein